MQATQALYRTWRPKFFSDVVEQAPVITTLRNQIASGRISHAYLFSGTRGTGKTTIAKIMARAVNCMEPQAGEPCGHCAACQALSVENNMDVIEIDAASNNGVDDIRDLREKVKYPPQHGRFRVYIIDEVHMLSQGAFNALLKTLEEPPEHVVFILATTEPQRLPATILSRCQRLDFHRIGMAGILSRLEQVTVSLGVEAEDEALTVIARAAEGAMRDALSILDMCLSFSDGVLTAAQVRGAIGAADPQRLFELAKTFFDGDAGQALRAVDRMLLEGLEAQTLARNISEHLRCLLIAQSCEQTLAELLSVTGERAAQYRAQAEVASQVNLLRLLDLFLAAEHDLKWSSQPRFALEAAVVRACLPEESLQLEQLAARVEQLERAWAEGPARDGGMTRAGAPVHDDGPGAETRSPATDSSTPGKERSFIATAVETPASVSKPVGDAAALWAQALKQLARSQPGLHAALKQGSFEGIAGDTARVAFAPAAAVFVSLVQAPEKVQAVEQTLTEVFGRPLRLEIGTPSGKQGPKAPESGAGDAVLRAVELFGRENVQVVDNDSFS